MEFMGLGLGTGYFGLGSRVWEFLELNVMQLLNYLRGVKYNT